MNNVDALKSLYVALGGDADDVAALATNPELIYAIATLIESGATKELPAVTTDDNGKVLKVESGKWAVGTDQT